MERPTFKAAWHLLGNLSVAQWLWSIVGASFTAGAAVVLRLPPLAVMLFAISALSGLGAVIATRRERREPARSDIAAISISGAASVLKIPASPTGITILDFAIQGRQEATESVNCTPSCLRFVDPVTKTVRAADLPTKVRLGRGESLVIKRFTSGSITFEALRK